MVSNAKELSILREKYGVTDDTDRKIKPAFFAAKDKGKGYYDSTRKNYSRHDTTMDYLQAVVNSWVYTTGRNLKQDKFLPFSHVIIGEQYRPSRISNAKIQKVFDTIQENIQEEAHIYALDIDQRDKFRLASEKRQECIDTIGAMSFGVSTMVELLMALEQQENQRIKRIAFNILFGYPNASFYNVIYRSSKPIKELTEDETGNLEIYGFRFKKQ